MGVAGRLRPRRLAEEAQLTPHGKRASCNGNHPSFSTKPIKKEARNEPLFFQSINYILDKVHIFQIYDFEQYSPVNLKLYFP